MNLTEFAPYRVTMLIGGIILFLLAAGLLVFFAVTKRSTKPALALLSFAILMIGFPAVKGFKGFGFQMEMEVNLVQDETTKVEKDPENAAAKPSLRAELDKLEANVTTNTAPAKVAETIAQAHVALGDPERAIKWANAALAENPDSQAARVVLDRANVSRLLSPDLTSPPTPVAANLVSGSRQFCQQESTGGRSKRSPIVSTMKGVHHANTARTST